ncbi:hypothetical protein [Couchioplanes caeruleus]|nr:hypothetical protein [Couchioplanes caeruleus]
MTDKHPARGHIMAIGRAVVAVGLAVMGGFFSVGWYLAIAFEVRPIEGTGNDLAAAGYGILLLVTLAVPMIAWRYLLPRVRWWGIPATLLVALGTYAAFTSNL